MNAKTLILMVLKPTIKRKADLNEVLKINFSAKYNTDELTLIAEGLKNGELKKVRFNNLKISENKNYFGLFESEIKRAKINYDKIHAVFLDIYFKEKQIKSTFFYEHLGIKKSSELNYIF